MRMSLRDENEIEWFLSLGEVHFMRSTTGPMLERAKVMSPSYTHDELDNRLPDKYDRRQPVGWTPPTDERGRPAGVVARGAVMTTVTANPSCGRPIEVTVDGAVRIGNDPPHNVVVQYASVSRRLSRVEGQSIEAGKHLRLYYGDSGAKWGRTKHGRIFSLYASTPAGKALVALVEKQDECVFLPADDRLGVIAELQGIPSVSKLSRKRALDLADKQAWAMYRAACLVWLGVVNGKRD